VILSEPRVPRGGQRASTPSTRVPGPRQGTAVLKAGFAPPADQDRALAKGHQWSWAIVLLVLGAACYNAVLAFLNARGLTMQKSDVVLAEIALLSTGGLLILACGPRRGDTAPAALGAFFVLDALIVSMLGNSIFVDMARNAAIIAVFMMLGSRISERDLHRCFMLAAIAVAAVLLLEMASVEKYASWFAPADYFAQTRGIAKEAFDQLGLFGNSLGFDSRFAIVTLMDHRACSLFLEQVSLANFGVILVILLACDWNRLSLLSKGVFAALAVLIILTTNSRLALGLTLMTPVACLLTLRWNRFLTLLVMPATLLGAAVIGANATAAADDLPGRLEKTVKVLGSLDIDAISGLEVLKAPIFADSGYAYVIYASTILGMLVLWLFVSLVASQSQPRVMRCSLLLNLYVFSSLTISGNSVFSIKTAALLWLLVGHVRGEALTREAGTNSLLDSNKFRGQRGRMSFAGCSPSLIADSS